MLIAGLLVIVSLSPVRGPGPRESRLAAIADTVGTAKLRDWWTVCKEGSLWEVEMYFAAGVDPNQETIERGTSLRRPALQLAAREHVDALAVVRVGRDADRDVVLGLLLELLHALAQLLHLLRKGPALCNVYSHLSGTVF